MYSVTRTINSHSHLAEKIPKPNKTSKYPNHIPKIPHSAKYLLKPNTKGSTRRHRHYSTSIIEISQKKSFAEASVFLTAKGSPKPWPYFLLCSAALAVIYIKAKTLWCGKNSGKKK